MFLTSDSTKSIFPAYVKAWAELDNAKKNAQNPHLKNKYADIGAILGELKESLSKNGLAIMQPTRNGDSPNSVVVTTLLVHESGEWMSQEFSMGAVDSKAQSIGGAITYARRYSLSAMFATASEDDDGNTASGVSGPKQTVPAKQDAKAVAKQESKPVTEDTDVDLADSTSTYGGMMGLGMEANAYKKFAKSLFGGKIPSDKAEFVKPNADLYNKLKSEGKHTVKQFNENPESFGKRLADVYASKNGPSDSQGDVSQEPVAEGLTDIANELASRMAMASGEVLVSKIRDLCVNEDVTDDQICQFLVAYKEDRNTFAALKASIESGAGMAGYLESLK